MFSTLPTHTNWKTQEVSHGTPGRLTPVDMDVDIVDIRWAIQNLPDVFPVMVDKTVAVSKILSVGVDMGLYGDEVPVVVLTGRDMEVGDTDVGRDIRVLTDVCPLVLNESATEPLSLPVVVETGSQVGCEPDLYLSEWNVEVDIVDIRWDIQNLPDVFPVRFDKTAAVPKTLHVGVAMGPQVDEDPVVVLTGRDMEVGDADVERDVPSIDGRVSDDV